MGEIAVFMKSGLSTIGETGSRGNLRFDRRMRGFPQLRRKFGDGVTRYVKDMDAAD